MTTMSPFRIQLEQAVNARHSRMNPFTEKWVNGELTRAQLGAWCKQHYQYVSQFHAGQSEASSSGRGSSAWRLAVLALVRAGVRRLPGSGRL